MRILTSLIVAASVFAIAPAIAGERANDRGEARLAKALDGRVAGEPVDCISLNLIHSSQIFDGTAIVYEGSGGKLYVNRPESGASSLDSDVILLTKTHSSQLCSIDTVRLLDRGSRFERGFVGLGKFVPYTKPRRD